MKPQLIFSILIILLMMGTTACAVPTSQPQPTAIPATPTFTAESNTEIVLKMIEKLNNGDVEGSLAYFADDAIAYLIGFPPTGIEVYKGKEQIRYLWEDSAANHFLWEVKKTSSSENIVYLDVKTWHDFTRELEVAPLEYIDVYEIVDGKIVTYGSWLTEESLTRFRPAFMQVVPPEPTPLPPVDPPVTEFKVTIAEGTCTTSNPPALKVGLVTVNLEVKDTSNALYALTIFTLDPGKDILDLMVATAGNPPSWSKSLLMKEIEPGKSASYTINVKEGPVHVICWSKPPDLPIGNAAAIPVLP